MGEELRTFNVNKNKYIAFNSRNGDIIVLIKTLVKAKQRKIEKICKNISKIIHQDIPDKRIEYVDNSNPIFVKLKKDLEDVLEITYV